MRITTSARSSTRPAYLRTSAAQPPSLSGITLDGRLAVVYSRFDLGNGWEQFPHPYTYGYSDKDGLAIGTNVIVTAVTH